MTITEYYRTFINNHQVGQDDFRLFPFREGCFIGFDSEDNLCVVIKSSSQSTVSICQKTRFLSVECNIQLNYQLDEKSTCALVHILRCFSTSEKERELFLELMDAMILQEATDETVMETFRTLVKFFADKSEPSDAELVGLYAELDAIRFFSDKINLAAYWQSKDRLKFDFSFSNNLKLEVKATTSNFRTHHFRHEQLAVGVFNIYVLSYMLRYDDEGISLFELINQTKKYLFAYPKKLTRINLVLKNVGEDRLNSIKFSSEFTKEKRHFYKASDIPRFPSQTPDGVANAEYDCNLENITYIDDEQFISIVMKETERTE